MKSKKLLSILLVLSLAMCIFPASAFAAPGYEEKPLASFADTADSYPDIWTFVTLKYHTDVVVRSGPGTYFAKIGTAYIGDTIGVYDLDYGETGWAQVDWNGRVGYIRADLLS